MLEGFVEKNRYIFILQFYLTHRIQGLNKFSQKYSMQKINSSEKNFDLAESWILAAKRVIIIQN